MVRQHGPTACGMTAMLSAFAFIATCFTTPGFAADRVEAGAALKQSEPYFTQNNFPTAIELLNRAIRLDPTYGRAYAWRGDAYLRMGNRAQAITDFDTLVRLDPENPENYKTRGDGFMQMKRFGEALRDYKKMYELEPWNAKGYSLAGSACLEMNDFDSALAELDRGVQENPNYAPIYLRRGQLFVRVGLAREAEMEFRMGYRLIPAEAQQNTKADIEKVRREPHTGSLKRQAPAWTPDAQKNGIRLQVEKQHRAAIGYLDAAVAADPTNAEAYRYRGRAYSDLFQIERAIEDIDKAIQLDPNDAEAHRLRGIALQSFSQGLKAIDEFTVAIGLAPNRAVTYLNRAKAYRQYQANRPSLALADAQKAVEVEPDNPYAWHFRAVVRLEQRDPVNHVPRDPGGMEDFNKAIALKPDFADAYCNRGFDEYVQFHDPVSGRRDLDRCFQLKPQLRTYFLREILTGATKLNAFEEAMQLYLETSMAGAGCGGDTKEDRGDRIVITHHTCSPEQLQAYARKIARLSQNKATLADPGPCEGKHAGGSFNACLAGDFAESDRFDTGSAMPQDKVKYGKY